MTVRQLIEALSRCPNPDAIVILQKDAEGNGFSPLRDEASNDVSIVEGYVADTTWSGEVHDPDEMEPGTYTPCVVLVPIN